MFTLCILALVFWVLYGKAVREWATWLETTFKVLTCVAVLAAVVQIAWWGAVKADYEQVAVMVTTESGVVEVNDEDYYKNDTGDYYTITNDEKALWVPFCLPTFEKVDAPVFEYDNLNPQPPTAKEK